MSQDHVFVLILDDDSDPGVEFTDLHEAITFLDRFPPYKAQIIERVGGRETSRCWYLDENGMLVCD